MSKPNVCWAFFIFAVSLRPEGRCAYAYPPYENVYGSFVGQVSEAHLPFSWRDKKQKSLRVSSGFFFEYGGEGGIDSARRASP
ncbi:hypothetical protein, partial [Cronobacter sakazakii]|uniref:hypothetical protein n=1 Tax=Cronobacter sakazakii TaxID=28141 RepID=UPI0019550F05